MTAHNYQGSSARLVGELDKDRQPGADAGRAATSQTIATSLRSDSLVDYMGLLSAYSGTNPSPIPGRRELQGYALG
jgi:hypothetical protein